ncbi:MAG: hypothetical protein GY948_03190 [Alphaproteobacteria bacterium]|nr:hypothetical protein [Alphaproteobacteria bacterium]
MDQNTTRMVGERRRSPRPALDFRDRRGTLDLAESRLEGAVRVGVTRLRFADFGFEERKNFITFRRKVSASAGVCNSI